jgi:mRNA interferase RelE/StbE
MASYRIEWKASALRELRKLPHDAIPRILARVEELKENPFPQGSRKLAGGRSSYRIREGDYRVIYSLAAERLMIEIQSRPSQRRLQASLINQTSYSGNSACFGSGSQ